MNALTLIFLAILTKRKKESKLIPVLAYISIYIKASCKNQFKDRYYTFVNN